MEYKITVIIPVYNMEQFLRQCLESVLNQTIEMIEVIAVDDGSTDNSMSILKEYEKQYINFTVCHQENRGQAVAKNKGIAIAKGEYVMFMDPDDYYPNNNCLEKLYNLSSSEKYDICGGIMLDNNNGSIEVTDPIISKNFYRDEVVWTSDYPDIYHHQRYMYKLKFLKENKILFPEYRRYEDPPFSFMALSIAKKFYAANLEMYVHRIGYKQTQYSYDICRDVLSGMCDVLEICKRYNNIKVYNNVLSKYLSDNVIPIYKYLYCGYKEIDELVEKIFKYLNEWEAKYEINREAVIGLKSNSIVEYNKIKKILTEEKCILYGAGGIARIILDLFTNNQSNIMGIAVSQNAENIKFDKYTVKNINEYSEMKNDITVIIATLEKHHVTIKKTLTDLGFENIVIPNISQLRLATEILATN